MGGSAYRAAKGAGRCAVVAALLAGCVMPDTRSLRAKDAGGTEVWEGVARKLDAATWSVRLTSGAGRVCDGTLGHDAARRFEGPIVCNDGMKGEIFMLFNKHRGFGTLTLNGTTYNATIGET